MARRSGCWASSRSQVCSWLCAARAARAHASRAPGAAFTGLHVDVDAVRKDNEAKQGPDVTRKSGLIINTGGALLALRAAPRRRRRALTRVRTQGRRTRRRWS
jgi:hypothetical protein